mmetsp:Transcript_88717/g.185500  ORF Transcript_88717/g.185500 Transcript_88717/m.185500 type:complete len:1144 (+) Transcript_88717:168-3599(+)
MDHEVRQLMDMGFSEGESRRAIQQGSGHVEQALELLLTGTVGGEPEFPALTGGNDTRGLKGNQQDNLTQVSTGLELAVPQDSFGGAALEVDALPIVPRKDDIPVGLRNVGNTCYINSLLQTLLHIHEFRDTMLRYRTATEPGAPPNLPPSTEGSPQKQLRRKHSIALTQELRKLFASALLSARGCLDPSPLLNQLVNVQIGSQQDVGESMLTLLEQLEEGLQAGVILGTGGLKDKLADREPEAESEAHPSLPPEKASPPAPQVAAAVPVDSSKSESGGDNKKLSLLQTLFFGEQVQVLSYRATGPEPPTAEPSEAAGSPLAAAVQDPTLAPAPLVLGSPSDPSSVPLATASVANHLGTDAQASSEADEAPPTLASPSAPPPPLLADAPPAVADADAPPPTASTLQVSATPVSPSLSPAVSPSPAPSCGEESPNAKTPYGSSFADAPLPSVPVGSAAASEAAPQESPREAIPDADGMVVREDKNPFLHIFLDVKHKSLYRAWEAARNTEVDYTTPSGSSTRACTSIWLKRLPKLLFFQLQRVGFNQDTKSQVKLDDRFEFDKTIYVDRFCLSNKAKSEEAAAHVKDLEEMKDNLEEAVSAFVSYRRCNMSGRDVLTMAAECLERNAAEQGPIKLADTNPDNVAASSGDVAAQLKEGAQDAVSLLRSLGQACEAQLTALREQIESLSSQIDEAYSDLRSQAYELHAIWVHSGIADSGHYWAFVRDWEKDRWYRMDDSRVTLVSWEEVHEAAVGTDGSHTSAYALVYMDRELAEGQQRQQDRAEAHQAAERELPPTLLQQIAEDNRQFKLEQADEELRRHAEAIFQHFLTLVYGWERKRYTADKSGDANDENGRKRMQDASLLGLEAFIYRINGEQDVWTYLITKSINEQRTERTWKDEDEPRILAFLAQKLRSQNGNSSMLRDISNGSSVKRAQLVALDVASLEERYRTALMHAQIVDEALGELQKDQSLLVKCIGMLAYVWANWRLDKEDKFRQNEVLLLMSTLIFNTVHAIQQRPQYVPDFADACSYFMLLLYAVEWPTSWKESLIDKLRAMGTPAPRGTGVRVQDEINHLLRDQVRGHMVTQQARSEESQMKKLPPGEEFFERHKNLYWWVMNTETIARGYVEAKIKELHPAADASAPVVSQ